MGSHAVRGLLEWGFIICMAGYLLTPSSRYPGLSGFFDVASDAFYGGLVVYWVVTRAWVSAGIGVAIIVLILWRDHRKGKRRKARESLGAKSRALRDALVRRVRGLRPSPVRVPVPVREGS